MFNLTKYFYNNFLVHIAVISIPFLSFINTNAHELDFVVIRTILIILENFPELVANGVDKCR